MIPGGASTYTFSSGSAIVSPTSTTSYSVTGTSSAGCVSSSATISNITVNPLPTITANSSASLICGPPFQGTATLTGGGASTYTWNTTATTNTISVTPSVTTSYTVTGTDANGCVNSSVFTQSVSTCAGINESGVMSSEFVVYPNPISNIITVISMSSKGTTSAPGEESIEIYNSLGERIFKIELKEETTQINLSEYAAGIYFVRIGAKVKKIVKE
jgi:hypothetical protein